MIKKSLLAMALTLILASAIPATAAAAGAEPLHAPANLHVLTRPQDAGRRIALTWGPVDGAFGYNVYRSHSAAGPFCQVGGKAADSMLDYPVFLDEGVEAGKGYYYAVAAVDADLKEGVFSQTVYAALQPAATVAAGAKRMVCSLSDQRIYFYEGDQLVNIVRCSTGLNNRTPTGYFRILGHKRVNVGLGGAVCDYWMSFTSAHGMHSWPRGTRSNYETGLGAPASHGCVRLHPLEAYWPYNWAPNGTPLTITYASLTRRIIAGCHSSVGVPSPSPDWYFAEGYTSEGYDTYLLLSNPGESGINANISLLKESGEVVGFACGITPHSRYTLMVDNLPGMDAAAFSSEIHADGPLVAERAMYFAAGPRTDGTVSMGATSLSPDWYFAEGYTAEGFDTYLLLANPGDSTVYAVVDFLIEGGAPAAYAFPIGPRSRFTVPVDSLQWVGAASFSMHVHADAPIVAERAMYFDKGYIRGGHSSVGAAQLSRDWYFAEGCTRDFFQSLILVGNPGEEGAIVAVDFYLNDASLRYEFLLHGRSRLTIPIAALAGLADTEMAFSVHSSQPVIAERSVYYDLDSHRGGHATVGSPLSSQEWHFAEGYTDSAFDTYLLLSNPGLGPAYVEVVYQRDDGAVFVYGYHIAAQRRVTVTVDDVPGLERASFSMVVRSDAPIVAERAMYFVMTRGY